MHVATERCYYTNYDCGYDEIEENVSSVAMRYGILPCHVPDAPSYWFSRLALYATP